MPGGGLPAKVFTEQDEQVARPRALLTVRACWWAVQQLRFEHVSVSGLARQRGTTWRTVWTSIRPLLQQMADDPARFEGVTDLGLMSICGTTSTNDAASRKR